jgi:hypothetical protein
MADLVTITLEYNHQKESPMAKQFDIPAPKADETPNECQARQLAEYDHNHAAGQIPVFINRSVTQDHAETPCKVCGRRTSGESYAHEIGCIGYAPHPDSIAGRPGYAAS